VSVREGHGAYDIDPVSASSAKDEDPRSSLGSRLLNWVRTSHRPYLESRVIDLNMIMTW
jgi:hypothetical protein